MPAARLQYLLKAYFKETASEQETVELMCLLEKEDNNEALQSLLDNMWSNFSPEGETWNDAKKADQFDKISRKIKQCRPPVKRMNTWYKVAAAAIASGVIITVAFFYNQHHKYTRQLIATALNGKVENDIPPGKDKAILILQNGTKLDLDSLQNINTAVYGFKKNNGNEIAFDPASAQNISYNTLSTPKGGKYKLQLPDGSMVWLNTASTLSFPTAFQGKVREVTLTGEAYFEIAQNAKQPFHVKVKNMDVQALGTHFNVMAYDNENSANTTLLEGSVKVSQGGSSGILKPGQHAAIDNVGEMKISEADIDETIAWKNDLFVFKKYDFAKVMRQIERWYNITVVYKSKVPEGKYSGIIGRNNNISQVLNILRASEVSFRIDGDKIEVE